MLASIHSGFQPYSLKEFEIQTLSLQSRALKGNPLGDSAERHNPILVPKKPKKRHWPVVFVLSGFTGNGPKGLNWKAYEENMAQSLDACRSKGEAPEALYVFVDAWTFWGGSQFINSPGTGKYEDYIMKELIPGVVSHFSVSENPRHWCVTGGSSGGYGSLHLASRFPQAFGLCAALAPDSFFEASLLPDLYQAIPVIKKKGGVQKIKADLKDGSLLKKKESHTILNAIGMGVCYSPHPSKKGEVEFPLDDNGLLVPRKWQKWKKHDPLVFLKKRRDRLKSLNRVLLDVGDLDQFQLQFGSRQICDILKSYNVPLDYTEFEGDHFDLSKRRPYIWSWLKKRWGD